MTTKSGKRRRGLESGGFVEDSRGSGSFWKVLKVSEGSWNYQNGSESFPRILNLNSNQQNLWKILNPSYGP
jgi:hypothetical protein